MTTGKTKITSSGFFNGIFKGDFFKAQPIVSESDIAALENYNKLLADNKPPEAFEQAMKNASKTAQDLANSANGAAVDIANIPKATKAATVGMKALSVAGNMIVFALISEGISKLMNIESDAADKAAEAFENSQKNIEKLQERGDAALNTTKELSEILSSEDWGVESAKKASEAYDLLADRLEEIGGAEEERIKSLREEAKYLRDNVLLSKEERLAKAEEERKKALSNADWDKNSSINKKELQLKGAQEVFWSKVDNEFSSFWNLSKENRGDRVLAIEGDVLSPKYKTKEDTDAKNKIAKQIVDIMKPYLSVNTDGMEYVALIGDDQYHDAIGFVEAYRKALEINGAADTELLQNLESIYNRISSEYDDIQVKQKELTEAKAKKDAYDYFQDNGFHFDSVDSKDAFIKFLKDKKYDQGVITSLITDLENGGFETDEYWKDIEDGAQNLNKMTVPLSDMKTVSENISALSSAFKELSDDGYISVETLSKIQEATGLSGDEWDSYQKKLLKAKGLF